MSRTYDADEVTFTVDGEPIHLGFGTKVKVDDGPSPPRARPVNRLTPSTFAAMAGALGGGFQSFGPWRPKSKRQRAPSSTEAETVAAAEAKRERKRAARLARGGAS